MVSAKSLVGFRPNPPELEFELLNVYWLRTVVSNIPIGIEGANPVDFIIVVFWELKLFNVYPVANNSWIFYCSSKLNPVFEVI